MKVPPPPPSYDKDRGITRRTVKGAAGGMLGVDYEDTRRVDPNSKEATTGRGENREAEGARSTSRGSRNRAAHATAAGPVREEAEMVLEDEDAVTRDAKARANRRGFVSRDRLTIDKNAPQLLRKRDPWAEWEDDPEDSEAEELEIDLDAFEAQLADGAPSAFVVSKRRARPGDPDLFDPAEIQRRLASPAAYAKHVMILSEAFRMTAGATREEAIDYLGAMFVAAPDRNFGRGALKELGPGTGILDIYPLEVVEHVVLRFPAFLPKVGFGRFCRPVDADEGEALELEVGVPFPLEYPPELKIRGFALKGGGVVGYRFSPDGETGRYLLQIDSPGEFTLLVSGLVRSGHTIIDTLRARVRGDSAPAEPEAARFPPRDAAKVERWPKPVPQPIDPKELLEEEDARPAGGMLSSGELVRRQQIDALRGPKGDDGDYGVELVDTAAAHDDDLHPAELDELSQAEAALLKLAFASSARDSDIIVASDPPSPEPPAPAREATPPAPDTEDFSDTDPSGDLPEELWHEDTDSEGSAVEDEVDQSDAEPELDDVDPTDRTQPIVIDYAALEAEESEPEVPTSDPTADLPVSDPTQPIPVEPSDDEPSGG